MSEEKGVEVMDDLLGREMAEKARDHLAAFDEGFARLVTETCFGTIWGRPGLDRRMRSIATISALTALGRSAELRGHITIGVRNGLTLDEIKEVIIHISQYAGIPASVEGMKLFMEHVRNSEAGQ